MQYYIILSKDECPGCVQIKDLINNLSEDKKQKIIIYNLEEDFDREILNNKINELKEIVRGQLGFPMIFSLEKKYNDCTEFFENLKIDKSIKGLTFHEFILAIQT